MDSNLIAAIERYCADHELTEAQFGVLVLNDKNFVGQLKDGRDIRFSTARKVEDFIASAGRAAA
jgi:hypothetical protein